MPEIMTVKEAIQVRHSVRSYTDTPITGVTKQELEAYINQCNQESGMHMQLITDEPNAFSGMMAHYGKFVNTKNYIGVVVPKTMTDETIGYYGEKVVLKAQQLGLNTCWVALTYNKKQCACKIDDTEKMPVVISIGYGTTQGSGHTPRPLERFYQSEVSPIPEWFMDGVRAAAKAPTAINQQKFVLKLHSDNTVSAKAKFGFCTNMDLGIVKYHFEIGAEGANWKWRT